jgi:hypothetical protein
MKDFIDRQCVLIQTAIADYRRNDISLNTLVNKLDGLRITLEDSVWSEDLFEPIFDIERINSEVIDKKRPLNSSEMSALNAILTKVELLVTDQRTLLKLVE